MRLSAPPHLELNLLPQPPVRAPAAACSTPPSICDRPLHEETAASFEAVRTAQLEAQLARLSKERKGGCQLRIRPDCAAGDLISEMRADTPFKHGHHVQGSSSAHGKKSPREARVGGAKACASTRRCSQDRAHAGKGNTIGVVHWDCASGLCAHLPAAAATLADKTRSRARRGDRLPINRK